MALWVFGYGSLMWRPGFSVQEAARATLTGFRRCFCIYSVHHRGTEARPGLVLGLDRGGSCEGMAFRVGAEDVHSTLAYLRAREQVNGVYREARVAIDIAPQAEAGSVLPIADRDRRQHVWALTYLVERAHPSYAARLPLAIQARIIRGARGLSGNNMDYLANTLAHLRSLGIRERDIERLAVLAGSAVTRVAADGVEACPKMRGMTHATSKHRVAHTQLRPDQRRRFLYRKALGHDI